MILKFSSPPIIGALLWICKYLIAFSAVATLAITSEASVMSAFPYHPLSEGQIRILEIAPGGTYDILDCGLIYANLGEEQITPYEALSYHWGEGSMPIVVDGHQFNVTANLYSALIYLRDTTQSRRIWIDAICINQNLPDEKSEQVQLMRRIYQRAARTIVWLGEGSSATLSGFSLIPRLINAQVLREQAGERRRLGDLDSSERSFYGLPSQYEPIWWNFLSIFTLPYFTRVWIIQEVAVSSKVEVSCGSESVTWDDLMTAISSCIDFGVQILYDMRSTEHPRSIEAARISTREGVEWDLLELLVRYRSFQASDQMDKIYALLGLANARHGVKPDYRTSFTVEDAYIAAGKSLLTTSPHLNLLGIPRAASLTQSKLPSWVPDWRADSDVSPLLDFWMPDEIRPTFYATGDSRSKVTTYTTSNELEVHGHVVDIVDVVGEVSVDTTIRWPSVDHQITFGQITSALAGTLSLLVENAWTFMNWEEITRAHSRATYLTGEDMLDAYWKTFLGGHTVRKDEKGWAEERARWEQLVAEYREPSRYRLFDSKVMYGAALGFSILKKSLLGAFGDFTSHEWPPDLRSPTAPHTLNRRMFTTRDGYIGLGPKDMQPRDKIALLSGGRLPFVLRPDGSSFRLVGDCYIHGMMAGERYDSEKSTMIRLT